MRVALFALLAMVPSTTASSAFMTNDYVERFHIKMWEDFKGGMRMEYDGAGVEGSEDHTKMLVFKANLMQVEGLSTKNPGTMFGFNRFSVMDDAEFAKGRFSKPYSALESAGEGGFRQATAEDLALYTKTAATAKLPADVDRRRDMAVSHVKHSGSCATSAAFAVSGAIEGALAAPEREGGAAVLRPLAEQHLLSCVGAPCTCDTPCTPRQLLAGVLKSGGAVPLEEDYDYECADAPATMPACRDSGMRIGAVVTEVLALPAGDVDFLKRWVQHRGPFMASFANTAQWKTYQEGIVRSSCNSQDALVSGLVLGYSKDKDLNQEYWLVKMPWGSTWGMHGLIRLATDAGCLIDPLAVTADPPAAAAGTEAEAEL